MLGSSAAERPAAYPEGLSNMKSLVIYDAILCYCYMHYYYYAIKK
jgi:hypothetical protein